MDKKALRAYIVFVVFALLFVLGLNFKEYEAVLEKAIKICFSCVGIG